MSLSRRKFVASACGWAAASSWNCSPTDTTQDAGSSQESHFEFVPYVVGANTAITGWGFFDAVDLLVEIGFRTIEVQNLLGKLEPTPDVFPGFEFDKISEEDKERILESLKPFDHVTVHLPYPADMNYIAPAADEAIKRLKVAMDAAGAI